jgi:hypothetical protein
VILNHLDENCGMMCNVPKFDFNNLVGLLRPEDIDFRCAISHVHSVAIVNAYDVDLYQSWTIEMDHFFREEMNARVTLFDIGNRFFHRQRSILKQIIIECRRFISKHVQSGGLHRYTIPYNYKTQITNMPLTHFRAFKSTLNYLLSDTLNPVGSATSVKSRSLFSTFASTLGTVEFKLRRHPVKLYSLNVAFEDAYEKSSKLCTEINPCILVVGNGRLVKPAAVVAAARTKNIPVLIIERGSFPGTYDLYNRSPHSIQERREQADLLLRRIGSKEAERIALNYITLRREYDPISGIAWHRKFKEGHIPELDNRKVCVCFSSTETEFAVFGDSISPGEFQSQEEAFRHLASELSPIEWQIIIRRHPYGVKKYKSDPERKLWDELSRFPHVTFVQPNDPVDSYELVRKADLVAHFNSSMGPEAISMQCAPVITMGPNIWEEPDSIYFVNSPQKLSKYLPEKKSARKLSDIHSWGLYWASFGYKFRTVDWIQNKGYVHGRRLL